MSRNTASIEGRPLLEKGAGPQIRAPQVQKISVGAALTAVSVRSSDHPPHRIPFFLITELGSVMRPSSKLCFAGVDCRIRHGGPVAVPFCSVEHALNPWERLVPATVAELRSEDGALRSPAPQRGEIALLWSRRRPHPVGDEATQREKAGTPNKKEWEGRAESQEREKTFAGKVRTTVECGKGSPNDGGNRKEYQPWKDDQVGAKNLVIQGALHERTE